jgi:hypothetical protein
MRRPGQNTDAYRHIVKALETPAHGAHSAYVQLWPFIVGTLLRQVTNHQSRCPVWRRGRRQSARLGCH